MAKKKLTLDDIFEDDTFGLLEPKVKTTSVKSDEQRLIDSFEEINTFFDKNNRVPNSSSMSEYSLMAKLKNFRENADQKELLKPYDRHNLLGVVKDKQSTLEDILEDEDAFGLLDSDSDLDIFRYEHTPKKVAKAETDFIARRKPIKESEFEQYEKKFQRVHQEIKEGKRKIKAFKNSDEHLKEGRFYILDGILLLLERINYGRKQENLSKNTVRRKDGRTRIIFENGTLSNMLYRSLAKGLDKNGKMVTELNDSYNMELFVNSGQVGEKDWVTGWIYVLKSMSTNPNISSIKNLHKIGLARVSVDERIKNAKNEATYLFAEVKKVATYRVFNRNADKLESLLHRFFANACLDIDLFNEKGQRLNPREWFVVPLDVINQAIQFIIDESIVNYEYDATKQKIVFKK